MRSLLNSKRFIPVLGAMLGAALIPAVAPAASSSRTASSQAVPWRSSQTVMPKALAKELALSKGSRPVIVCVTFRRLYKGGHIPAALYKGPGREADALMQLKAWARSIPKDTPVIIYCGCCPVSRCPNIRPAFEALRNAGLTNVRVLDLKQSFVQDWMQKGYPTQK